MRIRLIALFAFVALMAAACSAPPTAAPATSGPPTDTPVPPAAPTNTPVPPTATPAPPTDTLAPPPTAMPAYPSDPQRIEFQTEDGVTLVGYYYPASVGPAPVVVLMHWVGGSHCEWLGVNLVQWLQNRGLPEGVAANPACQNAEIVIAAPLDLYPPMPAGLSYTVFAFDFRGHGESGGPKNQWLPEGWLKDSIAAVQTARTLPGADPERVAAMGASIGADGAIDGCAGGCLGALSFSPGSYFEVPYKTAVETLGEDEKPAWCIAGTGDGEAFPTCESAGGDNYTKIIYEDQSLHGLAFFMPEFAADLDPDFRQTILDFVRLVFGAAP
jgi:dienelactone hydrolase